MQQTDIIQMILHLSMQLSEIQPFTGVRRPGLDDYNGKHVRLDGFNRSRSQVLKCPVYPIAWMSLALIGDSVR